MDFAEPTLPPASRWHYFAALWVGFLATPFAVGLSLQFLPFGAPALIYGAASGALAVVSPQLGWRWGLWTTAGMLIFTLAVATLQTVLVSPDMGAGLVQVIGLFGIAPAAVGGCVLAGLTARVHRA